ncbi:hypothetical protein [Marinobacter alexandrii]|uniref:hypothetical protein n=1 Tax=Marinobacter alexandrii TaxID=2570351 RepID=UPI001108FD1E|nr:hypothetical protein [Marinobacter alexandrii]
MTPKQEILAITELAIDITDLNTGTRVHITPVGSGEITVTVFDAQSEIEWNETLLDQRNTEAYLPKLRFLRHRLAQMHKEALAQRMESGA